MTKHTLKILDKYWWPIQGWQKTCEIRKDDRAYKVWDHIEFVVIGDKLSHLPGAKMNQLYEITHVLYFPEWLRDWYKALSIRKL